MGNKHTTQPISFQNESPSDDFGRSTINNNNHSHHHRNKPVMDRLRKSFRGSFRKKKDHHITESSKPHQWQADEQAVRNGTCSFPVKYLGCVEVYESRGMHVCEEALKLLRNSRRRPIKGNLFVTGDGLRVVDEETKGLLVDQTIEKVSFCAPDRNHEKGFSYICRDGTTRRWMCHGFHALKDSGDRLSHAVGCAFAVCLERKQKRDKELVSMNFDSKTSTFTRTGSFRQVSLTERLTDIQSVKPSEPPPIKPVHNPYAIERPHATPQLLQRQGSFRGLGGLSQSSPFKRQLSLRLNDLPSNLERTRSHSLESAGDLFPPAPRSNGASTVTPIPEASPSSENKADTISAMCKELSQGLSLLSNNEDPLNSPSKSLFQSPKSFNSNGSPMATPSPVLTNDPFSAPPALPTSSPAFSFNRTSSSSPFDLPPGDEKITLTSNIPLYAPATSNLKSSSTTRNGTNTPNNNSIPQASTTLTQQQQLKNIITTSVSTLASSSTPTKGQLNMSLHNRSITSQFTSPSRSYSSDSSPFPFHRNKLSSLGSARTTEAGLSSQHSSQLFQTTNHSSFDNNSSGVLNSSTVLDPFDADWVAFENRHQSDDSNNIHRSTNPFIPNTAGRVKAFQVQM